MAASLTVPIRIARALASGKYTSLREISVEFDVPIERVAAIARFHGEDVRLAKPPTSAETEELRKARRSLLKSPSTRIINKTFGGDLAAYQRCVEANFPE
jgi:hypothetical protein